MGNIEPTETNNNINDITGNAVDCVVTSETNKANNVESNTDYVSRIQESDKIHTEISTDSSEDAMNKNTSNANNIEPIMKPHPNGIPKPKPTRVWFQDKIRFYSSLHAHGKRGKRVEYDNSEVAVVLAMTTRFVLDLEDYRYKYKTTFVSIVNSHIKEFSLIETDMMDKRLRSMCNATRTKYRNKGRQKSGAIKKQQCLLSITKITIFKSEVLNASEVNFQDFICDPLPASPAVGVSGDPKCRFQDPVAFTPWTRKRNYNHSKRIALALHMTNRFIMDMHACHIDTGNSYTSILNPHIKSFDLIETRRLESQLKSLCVGPKLSLSLKGKRKRAKDPLVMRKMWVLKSEIRNFSGLKFGNMGYSPDSAPVPNRKSDEAKSELSDIVQPIVCVQISSNTSPQRTFDEILSSPFTKEDSSVHPDTSSSPQGTQDSGMNVNSLKQG